MMRITSLLNYATLVMLMLARPAAAGLFGRKPNASTTEPSNRSYLVQQQRFWREKAQQYKQEVLLLKAKYFQLQDEHEKLDNERARSTADEHAKELQRLKGEHEREMTKLKQELEAQVRRLESQHEGALDKLRKQLDEVRAEAQKAVEHEKSKMRRLVKALQQREHALNAQEERVKNNGGKSTPKTTIKTRGTKVPPQRQAKSTASYKTLS